MNYDTWKSTDERDRDYEPVYDDERAEERDDDVTTEVPSAQQIELEDLRGRIALARVLVLAALDGAERGHSMPWARLDSLLTGVLVQLGCATCGRKFTRDDASQLVSVRKCGVHAGTCGQGGGRQS